MSFSGIRQNASFRSRTPTSVTRGQPADPGSGPLGLAGACGHSQRISDRITGRSVDLVPGVASHRHPGRFAVPDQRCASTHSVRHRPTHLRALSQKTFRVRRLPWRRFRTCDISEFCAWQARCLPYFSAVTEQSSALWTLDIGKKDSVRCRSLLSGRWHGHS